MSLKIICIFLAIVGTKKTLISVVSTGVVVVELSFAITVINSNYII